VSRNHSPVRPLERRAPRVVRVRVSRFAVGDTRRRLIAILTVTAALFAVVLGRIVWLQLSQADDLRAAGLEQRTSTSTLPATRGAILDRNGQELALSVPMTTVSANPKLVVDPEGTVLLLASVLPLSIDQQQSLVAAFTDRTKSFVYVSRQVDDARAAQIEALQLPGIELTDEDKRVMPDGQVARSVVGRTDIDGVGTAGVELMLDDELTGTAGTQVREHDRSGRSLPGGGTTTVEPVAGSDVVLTIDRPLQYEVEQALVRRVTELNAAAGRVVILDVNGEILALATVQRGDDGVVYVTAANTAVVEANEPGSTAKAFSIAAAINDGAVTPDSTFEVPWKLTFNEGSEKWEQTIKDAYEHPTVPMAVDEILYESSNVGTWLATQGVSKQRYEQYLQAFGFGAATAVGLPKESAGILKPADEWYGLDVAAVRYGYGFSTTTLQLAAAMNTFANDGVYVEPKLVKSTIDAGGTVVDSAPSATREVISASTAATMTGLLTEVVCNDEGTGVRARVPGMTVAGKTGTSYKIQANGTYEGDNGERSYFATFAGYLPADDPQLTIVVSIDEPDPTSQDRFGGKAAAPLFSSVAQTAVRALGIAPSPGDEGCGAPPP
jgi:cell division protein FtsI (penicillin-binding protein 3)